MGFYYYSCFSFNMVFYKFSSGALKGLAIVSVVLQIALLLGTILGCSDRMLYGPICGVVVAILMILSFSIIDIIIGVLFLIECINLIRYMKKK